MKSSIATIAILALVGMGIGMIASADDEAGVVATVTVQNISITVGDGEVAYGTLAVNTSKDTTAATGGLNDTQTVTNTGNVDEDFEIRGQNSDWTLASTPGDEQYVHEFCKVDGGDCDGTPVWDALSIDNQGLATDVIADDTKSFDLKINTPITTTNFDLQSVDVTIVATAS